MMREKLIQLLRKAGCSFEYRSATEIADDLIENGVTVQEWISVKDRLPEDYKERVLVKINDANSIIGNPDMDTDRYSFDLGFWVRWGHNVTHWMPLPKPPKGD